MAALVTGVVSHPWPWPKLSRTSAAAVHVCSAGWLSPGLGAGDTADSRGWKLPPRSPPRACCRWGHRHINQALESGRLLQGGSRLGRATQGHTAAGRGAERGPSGRQAVWVSCAHKAGTAQRLAFSEGGIKGGPEGLAGGIRHPLGHQQGLWTTVGSESTQPLDMK